jgi:hypothetical protein
MDVDDVDVKDDVNVKDDAMEDEMMPTGPGTTLGGPASSS